ncbi:hypothetical protein Pcinc_044101, partial [Petrolisthes cinctipes]
KQDDRGDDDDDDDDDNDDDDNSSVGDGGDGSRPPPRRGWSPAALGGAPPGPLLPMHFVTRDIEKLGLSLRPATFLLDTEGGAVKNLSLATVRTIYGEHGRNPTYLEQCVMVWDWPLLACCGATGR